MTYTDGLSLWFIVVYALSITAFIIVAIRFRAQRDAIEKQKGPLPSPGIFVPLGVPLLILLTRVGEIPAEWLSLRLIGLGLSLYYLVILLWTLRTLGRQFVPGAGIFRDHTLVTSGPFRFVRHPLYSASITSWLGAALGTLNWLLLVLWPVLVAIVILVPVRHEEELLHEKFGKAYEVYAQHTDRLIPKLWGRR